MFSGGTHPVLSAGLWLNVERSAISVHMCVIVAALKSLILECLCLAAPVMKPDGVGVAFFPMCIAHCIFSHLAPHDVRSLCVT